MTGKAHSCVGKICNRGEVRVGGWDYVCFVFF